MANLKVLKAGLEILDKYVKENSDYDVGAFEESIAVQVHSVDVPKEDFDKLYLMGWSYLADEELWLI